ncbi:MAG: DegT/DnrJ/EryC1/StrS family aminotransferase [Clostridia bacterium]|nr:DegT/DnrJ/EryC1/StrS family aminotransferase [Clostridia bacterium]
MIKYAKGCLGEEELIEVKEAFEYGYFGLAGKVLQFEDALKNYLDAKNAVAVNTGTSALHLSLDALGITKGDEVIVPSMTFVATYQVITLTGATPVSCDIYPENLLIDINDVKNKITDRTKAIIPVHYLGNPCNMDELLKLKEQYGIRIVEDAAHAIGSEYNGRKIGSFGDITCFSFDSIKTITCGEGGAVICQDPEFADILRQKRLLGIDRKSHTAEWKERSWLYDVNMQGYRYHMSNINAAIGLGQLRKIDKFIARRREICARYDDAFSNIEGIRLLDVDYDRITPFMYVIRAENGKRDELMSYLKNIDIETSISYIPNHFHTLYKKENESLPHTEKAFEEILSIPLHYGLSDEDVEKVIAGVKSYFKQV